MLQIKQFFVKLSHSRLNSPRIETSGYSGKILLSVCLSWSLFHLWYASSLPFVFNIFILNETQARSIHLAFAVFLGFTSYPAFRGSSRQGIPVLDWLLASAASFCAVYLYVFYSQLADRPGAPITLDLAVALCGIVLLLEAARRSLGPPLVVIALLFMAYTFLGQYMPDVIAHKGASFRKGMSHYWLTTEGVYGIALGVSTSMVFMFVLFGSLLDRAGAGNYFIRAAYAGMGHLRGGPAKAAVVASAMTGMVSGSSTANVVTTGTFTIPLMKRVGLSAEKAGAIEVASSTNGQLMPPVMGAAAFLMVEYVGISYLEVIKHAFLPAFISYIALIYIVHLEAVKLNMQGIQRTNKLSIAHRMMLAIAAFIAMMLLTIATYYGLGWIKGLAGDATSWIVSVLLLIAYILLLAYACGVPELSEELRISVIPGFRKTFRAGCYYLLPLIVLMWCLTVERLSPSLSVFWATLFLIVIVLSQWRLKGYFRKQSGSEFSIARGFDDLIQGLTQGALKMVGIAVATAVAGIIVGTVTLTGIGFVMTELIEVISGGNMLLILIATAGVSLILGMGLPTTANYIVVSTLMAPVIVELGAENGLIIPLIAVHLFVFYFGILADDTPPVGIAAYAAAGISNGDPVRTGIHGFSYDIRTAILPFMFIYNTELLLIGVDSWTHLILVVVSSVIAILVFCSATQGWLLIRNKFWETALLLLICLSIFRPGIVWDELFPAVIQSPPSQLQYLADSASNDQSLNIRVRGERFDDGSIYEKVLVLPITEGESGADKLIANGLELRNEEDQYFVDNIGFASVAERAGFDFDQEILSVEVLVERPAKQYMYIPAMLLLWFVYYLQRSRRNRQAQAQVFND